MMEFSGRGIVVDIEGTTSSIRFVYDVLFPFARGRLESFLTEHGRDSAVLAACQRIASDAGRNSFDIPWIIAEVHRLMDGDTKATGLKELQGLIWQEGYNRGRLLSHVYDDVPPALRMWNQAGLDVRVYSSGSVTAQKAFFAHTDVGDLTGLFRGYFDTTIGHKRDPASYEEIAREMGLPAAELLFLSDVPAELDAAVGWRTALVVRPGNAAVNTTSHSRITSFDDISLRS